MKYVTLDDMIEEVRAIEARTAEPPEVTKKIIDMSEYIMNSIYERKPIKIITDYDCDGICFAYIMEKTIQTMSAAIVKENKGIDVEVLCNDRRESYGVPKNISVDRNAQYIIGDMGCTELGYIRDTFGKGAVVIDHHTFNNEDYRKAFNEERTLLNPHSVSINDSENAQYCATGLAYRVCDTIISNYERAIEQGREAAAIVAQAMKECKGSREAFKAECENKGITFMNSKVTENDGTVFYGDTVAYNNVPVFRLKTIAELYRIEYNMQEYLKTDTRIELGGKYSHGSAVSFPTISATINIESGTIQTDITEKFRNTIDIVAGIGTIADVVNILDEHSDNRKIVKTAMEKINNADENNIDFTLGHILARNGIGAEDVTVKKISHNIAPFFNSGSRMSALINQNGAQLTYDALTGCGDKAYIKIDDLCQYNAERKDFLNSLKSEAYFKFIESHRYGENKDKKIAIYSLSDETPLSFCGLIASNIMEATDKPTIVFTSHYDENTHRTIYSGSGRNPAHKESFLDYVRTIVATDKTIEINCGGHSSAFGISSLNNLDAFEKALYDNQELFKDKKVEEKRLLLSAADVKKIDTLKKVLALEPLGMGLELPPIEIEGNIQSVSMKGKNPHWQSVKMEGVYLTDWCYSDNTYIADGIGNSKVIAKIELNDYKGLHLDVETIYKRSFEAERSLGRDLQRTSDEKSQISLKDVL